MNRTALKKLCTLVALTCGPISMGLGVANANDFGNNVTCAANCYDFTVYSNSSANNTPGPLSKGFAEIFVSFNVAPGVIGTGNMTLEQVYFTASGIASPGATAIPLNYAHIADGGSVSFDTQTAPSLNTGAAVSSYKTGQFLNTYVNFSIGNTYYQINLNKGIAYINYSIGNQNYDQTFEMPQGSYSSSVAGVQALGTASAFGGQIAPEMDAQSAFNVFALLGCLALIYSRRKSFSEEKIEGLMPSIS